MAEPELKELEYNRMDEIKTSDVSSDVSLLDDYPESGVAPDAQHDVAADEVVADEVVADDRIQGTINFVNPSRFFRSAEAVKTSAALDLFAVGCSFGLVHLIRLGSLEFSTQRAVTLFAALSIMAIAFSASGLYQKMRQRGIFEEFWQLAVCWGGSFAALSMFTYFSGLGDSISRIWVGGSMMLALLVLVLVRIASWLMFSTPKQSRGINDVVLIGCGPGFERAVDQVNSSQNFNKRIVQLYQLDTLKTANAGVDAVSEFHVSSSLASACNFVERRRSEGNGVDEVWLALPDNLTQHAESMEKMFHDSATDVCFIPSGFSRRLVHGRRQHFDHLDIINISETAMPDGAERFKKFFDICVASCALLALSLPMAIIALLVRAESPGPVIFKQRRYGMDGEEIDVWKFRSMRMHSDTEVVQATKNDSRVTRIGGFLRRSSLDELPQFINVLQGTMSIIGPRPHAVPHNEHWRSRINGYMLRHKVRPGITGLAQVNGWRGETDTPEKMEQRVRCDLEYIRNWSPSLDIKIFCLTIWKGFGGKNAY